MEKYKDTRRIQPPDGGYGWVILIATILINITALPMLQCFGIIFQDKFIALDINATEISFMLHLNNSITCILGLFSGALLNRFTYREICITGSIMISCGICLTSLANSYPVYIFTTCILMGSGLGIMLPALSLAVNTYFKKRLTLAMTLQVTGTCVSPIFMPQVCKFLLNHFGTDGTVLILGGFSMHALLGSLLLKPLTESEELKLIDCDNKEDQLPRSNVVEQSSSADGPLSQQEIISKKDGDDVASEDLLEKPVPVPRTPKNRRQGVVYEETTVPRTKRKTKGVWRKVTEFFSFDLLRDRLYFILLIGMSVSYASELNIAFLMPFVLSELVNLDLENVANAMSIHAVADILGRLSIPFLAMGLIGFTPKMMYCLSLLVSCLGRTVLIFSENKLGAMFAASIIGYGKGTKAVLQALILPHYMPFDRLAAALGLLMTANGMISLIIGPIIGLVHDVGNSYIPSLYTASLISLFCVILWLIDYWLTISAQFDREEREREANGGMPRTPV